MPCSVLIDSCSYFRLADSLHPLLKTPFCEDGHSLGVLKDLQEEYKKNAALKHKFFWVDQKEYAENRKRCFQLTADQKIETNNAFYFIRETNRDMQLGVSRVDINCLAHAYVLEIPIVTDDSGLLALAKEYDVTSYKTLELLKIMYDCGHITIEQVRAIASYWQYLKDKPKSYKKDYKRLFGEPIP
ncbi:MAG: DNA-binding protein [Pseudomonadota bacterium]